MAVFRSYPAACSPAMLIPVFAVLLNVGVGIYFLVVHNYGSAGCMFGVSAFVGVVLFLVLPRRYEVNDRGVTIILACVRILLIFAQKGDHFLARLRDRSSRAVYQIVCRSTEM
jgi:hypothetical protein